MVCDSLQLATHYHPGRPLRGAWGCCKTAQPCTPITWSPATAQALHNTGGSPHHIHISHSSSSSSPCHSVHTPNHTPTHSSIHQSPSHTPTHSIHTPNHTPTHSIHSVHSSNSHHQNLSSSGGIHHLHHHPHNNNSTTPSHTPVPHTPTLHHHQHYPPSSPAHRSLPQHSNCAGGTMIGSFSHNGMVTHHQQQLQSALHSTGEYERDVFTTPRVNSGPIV